MPGSPRDVNAQPPATQGAPTTETTEPAQTATATTPRSREDMKLIQTILLPERWRGLSISGNGVKSQELREAMVEAQRALVRQVETDMPSTLRVFWVFHVGSQMCEWNPQVALPPAATEVSCVATTNA